jgi:hypothetical protein
MKILSTLFGFLRCYQDSGYPYRRIRIFAGIYNGSPWVVREKGKGGHLVP